MSITFIVTQFLYKGNPRFSWIAGDCLVMQDNIYIPKKSCVGARSFYSHDELIQKAYALAGSDQIRFSLYYPNASSVSIQYGSACLQLQCSDDYWTVQCHILDGFQIIKVYVNGEYVVSPCLPICYSANRICNYIDINQQERVIPCGSLVRETFFSTVLNAFQQLYIYLPPQYNTTAEQRFPVLFLQHGHGENETAWVNQGRIQSICDRLILNNEMVPIIIVMANGMLFRQHEHGVLLSHLDDFEAVLIKEIIPLIDRRYRTLAQKKYRGMAGLSMGSIQTAAITMKHQDIFSCAGLFSGFLHDLLGNDQSHLSAKNLQTYQASMDVFFRSIGDEDEFYPVFSADDAFLEENHIMCTRKIYHGGHEWNVWRQSFTDFIRLIFKEESAK